MGQDNDVIQSSQRVSKGGSEQGASVDSHPKVASHQTPFILMHAHYAQSFFGPLRRETTLGMTEVPAVEEGEKSTYPCVSPVCCIDFPCSTLSGAGSCQSRRLCNSTIL